MLRSDSSSSRTRRSRHARPPASSPLANTTTGLQMWPSESLAKCVVAGERLETWLGSTIDETCWPKIEESLKVGLRASACPIPVSVSAASECSSEATSDEGPRTQPVPREAPKAGPVTASDRTAEAASHECLTLPATSRGAVEVGVATPRDGRRGVRAAAGEDSARSASGRAAEKAPSHECLKPTSVPRGLRAGDPAAPRIAGVRGWQALARLSSRGPTALRN
mmetsp:Transcript_90497/g.255466  ORF Transcript_90497/g.255466 Transcript_90497/m.255466 type:complete len:223 (-) Transcript_90497:383-1051(-)